MTVLEKIFLLIATIFNDIVNIGMTFFLKSYWYIDKDEEYLISSGCF